MNNEKEKIEIPRELQRKIALFQLIAALVALAIAGLFALGVYFAVKYR